MKKLIFLALLFPSVTESFSQNRNSVWCFGDSAGIDFSSGSLVTFASGMDGRGSCVSIADTNGNLLFYAFTRAGTNAYSTQVFNFSHQVMQDGDTIIGEAWYNELVCVPIPNSNNQFYLLSMGQDNSNKGLYYSVVDMNLNGGLGAVTQKNVQLISYRNADCLQAIKHGNGRDWWVIAKFYNINTSSNNRFYKFLISPDGISSPIIQNLGDASDVFFQKIVFNPEGTKFMLINRLGLMCEYNFNRCTGNISNANIIYPEQTGPYTRIFTEGAYSPDGMKFYNSSTWYFAPYSDTSWVLQYDLTASNIAASSDTLFSIQDPVTGGAIRLAPDGKIYYTCWYDWGFPLYPYPDSVYNQYNMNLGVINYPDSIGAACDFQPFSFNLGGKRTYLGLPNNPDYSLGSLAGSPCDSLTGIKNNEAMQENGVLVFPNPVTDKLTITTNNNSLSEIILYDIASRKLLQQKFTNTVTLNTAQLAKGMYVYEVRNEKGVVRKGKVVKE